MTAALRPIIFARYPEAGRCKTRMIAALGAEGAADLQARLIRRALARLASLSPILSVTGGQSDAAWRQRFGGGLTLRREEGTDLGAHMLSALTPGPALVVGSDVPDMDAALVSRAAAMLDQAPVVLGPAVDGGFWLVAMRRPDARLFADVKWGSSTVLAQVLANAAAANLRVALAKELADCDRPEDLARWPDLLRNA